MKVPGVFLVVIWVCMLSACVSTQPHDINNICTIFKEHPRWQKASLDVARRWRVPQAVQLAIIHQESSFKARARPERQKIWGIIPWTRPSNAYGYTQALSPTWAQYQHEKGHFLSSRTSFSDGVDFIGWYANEAYKRAGISRDDAYSLYLAYHEGIGGYTRKTYLQKSWLIQVAKKVSVRSHIYQAQLNHCIGR